MRIVAVCGSLQRSSGNLSLLRDAMRLAPAGVEVSLFDGLRDLPHFNLDLEELQPRPEVERWRRAVVTSNALLIACPEYGFSLPGALKNGIDWLIGSGELEEKIIAVTASVNHPDRGRRGLAALLDALAAVKARIVGGVPIARGPGFEAEVQALLRALVEAVQSAR
jgi:NAD(P)H-dependent FMN reductase